MAQVRLKHSILTGKRLLKFGTVCDESEIPDHLLTDEHVSWDTDHRQGKVLLLIGLTYAEEQILNGQVTGFPVTLARGECVRLEDLPARLREDLRQNVDYLVEWTEEQRQKLCHEETERYLKYFQPSDKVEVYGV